MPSYSTYGRKYTRKAKRQASKIVRRYQGELIDGCQYKKVFCSWNIFDYKGIWLASEYDNWVIPRCAYSK